MNTLVIIPIYKKENWLTLQPKLSAIRKKSATTKITILNLTETAINSSEMHQVITPASLAQGLNTAINAGQEENILLLGGDCVPKLNWAAQMEKSLREFDLVVGETSIKLSQKNNPYNKLSKVLFHQYSQRAAQAKNQALPWGPLYNLGFTRKLWQKAGPFSQQAGTALDIDWCWRAILQNAQICFAPAAIAVRSMNYNRESLAAEFERFGLGESWLSRTYSYLLQSQDEQKKPLLASLEAFDRIRYHSLAAKNKSLTRPLEEISVAFAGGVRIGYEQSLRSCPIPRITPNKALGWNCAKNETTIFVPGKGLTTLKGKMISVWEAYRKGSSVHELAHLMEKIFRFNHHDAHHQAEEFCAALLPG